MLSVTNRFCSFHFVGSWESYSFKRPNSFQTLCKIVFHVICVSFHLIFHFVQTIFKNMVFFGKFGNNLWNVIASFLVRWPQLQFLFFSRLVNFSIGKLLKITNNNFQLIFKLRFLLRFDFKSWSIPQKKKLFEFALASKSVHFDSA